MKKVNLILVAAVIIIFQSCGYQESRINTASEPFKVLSVKRYSKTHEKYVSYAPVKVFKSTKSSIIAPNGSFNVGDYVYVTKINPKIKSIGMKKLADGSEVTSKSYYFLLDWNDQNKFEYMYNNLNQSGLKNLNIRQYRDLWEHATNDELQKMIKK